MKRFGIVILLLTIAWLPIHFLHIDGYNFWSDYTGYIGILEIPSKYLFTIQENFFGSFRYLFNSTVLLAFQWLVFKIFTPQFGTFIVIFSVNFLNACAGYKLSKFYLKSTGLSLLFTLIFIYNPVYLYALYVNLTLGFLMPIAGMVLFMLFISHYVRSKRTIYLLLLPFTSLLIAHPFMFFFYTLQAIFLFLYYRKYKALLIFLFLTAAMNLFWIAPFLIGTFKQTYAPSVLNSSALTKDTLESYVGYASTLNFMIRGDSFQKTLYGIFFPVVSLVWALFLFAIVKSRTKRIVLAIPVLVYVIFASGGTGFFGPLFNFVWQKFTFFHFFRSFTNVLYVAWYYLLFVILIHLKDSISLQKVKVAVAGTVLLLVAPVFLQNTYWTFGKTVKLPADYFKLQSFIDQQKDDYYIFRLPYSLYEYYSWDVSRRDKYFFEDFFNKGVVYNAVGMATFDSKNNLIGGLYRHLYTGGDARKLGDYGIKYVLISKDLTHISERYYLQLNPVTLNSLRKVMSSSFFDLYEIPGHREKLQSRNMVYRKLNPTEYRVNFNRLKTSQTLTFLAAYDPDWTLLAQEQRTGKWVEIFSDTHTIYGNWGNRWNVNAATIKSAGNLAYRNNPDGSLNISLRLHYRKQDIVTRGFAFSLGAIILVSACCIFLIIEDRNNA